MALNNLLSISLWIIIALIFIITISIIIFLVLTEKILKKKIVIKQKKEENSPKRRIKLLISTEEEPKNKLRKINAIAKEIFRNNYGIDSKISYYELAEKFQKQGKQTFAKFCQEMFKILYSGKELQLQKTKELAKLLEKIEKQVQEEKSFKNLEKNMKASIKNSPSKINLFKKFSKIENKFIDKFAKEKTIQEKSQQDQTQNLIERPKQLPKTTQVPLEYKTKREKLQNLPLIKLFKFKENSQTPLNLEKEITQKQTVFRPTTKTLFFKKKKEKSTYQKIEDLQKEVIEKEKQIETLRTKQQIQKLKTAEINIEINKNQSWPPVTFTPKHLNETRKMSPTIEDSFQKVNKEIKLLENEIKIKQNQMRKIQSNPIQKIPEHSTQKPSPIIKGFLKKISKETKNIDKEMSLKQKQINLINLKKEPTNYSSYSTPKVVSPKKQKIEATPKNKSLKKEEFIHHVDNMERIKSRIHSRRAGI
ncbi:MAG: hypothetical protein ABFQ65_01410 [Nanoarchaeota archaeon]